MVVLTTEEKLERFQQFCMEDVHARSSKMLDEYTDALEKTFAEHQADAHRRADMQIKTETEKIKRDINRKLSIEQINLKRTLGHKQDELKDMLFVELRDMLANFMETSRYLQLLEKQITSAIQLAGDEPLIIYMDPADEDKVRRLSFHHKADIRISEYSFLGGTRAVIPGKNILIDNSFQTKLAEERENFKFDLTKQLPEQTQTAGQEQKGGAIHG